MPILAATQTRRRHAFTVDVEDYYQVSGFAKTVPFGDWASYPSRVVENTQRVLSLLERHAVRGTFFILGWVAERHPELVRDIQAAGHEIGCHSYAHQIVYELSPDEFRDDLRRGRDILAEITGEPIVSYRAPSFSITDRSLWALETLAEEGFTIDASIYPIRHDRYGIPRADLVPHRIQTDAGMLWEFPGTCCSWGRFKLPVGGGGYLRLFPRWVTERGLHSIENRHQRVFGVYVHPWELDPDQPRLPARLLTRIRHYRNLNATEHRLERLLERFEFTTISDVLADVAAEQVPVYCSKGLYRG
ncbi:XrtA system polysaccharide deacetylase [Thalassoroseus pseudoceratinae]|uniref:XrtA system polysaccharide deacetylase n=1 Tax=Thalassoroseus pseudoceratinae TaxID=2713176 RepID=UPI00141EF863|nr:XrtA system polysaccharide deacetylase [Thalassoroseus pseudoceratinae]